MLKRVLSLILCALLFVCLLPTTALAEDDYDVVTIQKGDFVKKLLEANKLDYESYKYVVMVLNHMDREKDMEVLTIGDTIKIPKSPVDIEGSAPHLISSKDKIAYYVIPYRITAGDTLKKVYKLWGLSFDEYVDSIRALNPGKDLDLLAIGDLFFLPGQEKNLMSNTYTTVMSHVLLQDEKVESVFARYDIDFEKNKEELQKYNVTPFDRLQAGDKLMIPLIWNW